MANIEALRYVYLKEIVFKNKNVERLKSYLYIVLVHFLKSMDKTERSKIETE